MYFGHNKFGLERGLLELKVCRKSIFVSELQDVGVSSQDIVGDELEKALQTKTKRLRGQAIAVLEEKLMKLLTEEGVTREEPAAVKEDLVPIEEVVWDEEQDGELIVEDGEVDEGDIHVKPVFKKPVTEVLSNLSL